MYLESGPETIEASGNKNKGWIEVITGCMFSGKTEELIRRVNRAIIAKQNVKIFKPAIDTRYSISKIVSHDDNSIQSTSVKSSQDLIKYSADFNVIAIDEVQFFDSGIIKVCNELANSGKRVIAAGLDMDYNGTPFGCIPQLITISEFVTKLHAICAKCGEIASYSFRLSPSKEKVLLGAKDLYEARCRECFYK